MHIRPHLWVWPESDGEETASLKFGLRTILLESIFANASDARASLLNETNTMQHVGDQGVPAYAFVP